MVIFLWEWRRGRIVKLRRRGRNASRLCHRRRRKLAITRRSVGRSAGSDLDGDIPVGVAQGTHSEAPSPWSKREPAMSSSKKKAGDHEKKRGPLGGPIPEDMLRDIAQESSQSE